MAEGSQAEEGVDNYNLSCCAEGFLGVTDGEDCRNGCLFCYSAIRQML